MASPQDGLTMVWHDDFNRWKPVWSTRAVEHVEGQCARGDRTCARTHDGTLILSVREDPLHPGLFLAGHIGTKGGKEFTAYGYYEARVKFPTLPGVLCGWWLQSVEEYNGVTNPEVDIVENGGRRTVHHTLWYRLLGMGIGEYVEPPPTLATDLGYRDAQTDWHDYGVLWLPTGYTFFIDGKAVGALVAALSDTPKYLVLSIKIPTYMLDDFEPAHLLDYKMKVKWVRVWQALDG